MKLCFGIPSGFLLVLLLGKESSAFISSSSSHNRQQLSFLSTSSTSSYNNGLSFCANNVNSNTNNRNLFSSSSFALYAKKKAKGGPKIAQNLDFLDDLDDDEPMSKKDQMKAKKKAEKEAKKKANAAAKEEAVVPQQQQQQQNNKNNNLDFLADLDDEPMSLKDQMKAQKKAAKEAAKAAKQAKEEQQQEQGASVKSAKSKALKMLEMMEQDEQQQQSSADDSGGYVEEEKPKLSKKELKALKKAEEKKKAKMEAKAAKKATKQQQEEGEVNDESSSEPVSQEEGNNDISAAPTGDEDEGQQQKPAKKEKVTLEERIRKERPPPRIRVMESSQPDFSSLRLEDVYITFRNQEVLKGVTWGVQTGERVGLVGANGGGKTTQLRILAGELESTSGDVVKSKKDLRVSFLRQEFIDELIPTRTLMEEFMSVFEEENAILQSLRDAEAELEGMDGSDPDAMQDVLDRMQGIQGKADAKGVYALESRAQKIMDLMGFTEEEGSSLVSMFSGGWKMRLGLGKVLLKEPNILLLDEPTNHLDLESVEWLEAFLRNQNIPMVIVSHDREFLDQVCTKIVDTEGGIASSYDGNYSNFLKLKKARMDAWQASYDAQEKKIKEERKWINKFKAKQPDAVKSRQMKLDKLIKSPDYVQKPPFVGKPFRFRFPDAPRLSPEVAEVKGLSHSYESYGVTNTLFDDSELFIEKNDRIAVIGPNGSGKSTLLRIMMGKEEPNSGSAEIVGQNVVANYFEQNQADALDLDKTVIDTVQAASSTQSYNELRALLGQFLFKGDAVDKKVRNLSGGEKARLSLCCMMLRPANLLILDEPTNHLDIPAKEMLEEALQHFDGSVVVISHDRFFISKVATTIVAIEEKKLEKYAGDYKFYMDRQKSMKDKIESRYVKGVDKIGSAPIIDLEELIASKKKKNFGGAKNAGMVTRKNKGVKNAKRNDIK